LGCLSWRARQSHSARALYLGRVRTRHPRWTTLVALGRSDRSIGSIGSIGRPLLPSRRPTRPSCYDGPYDEAGPWADSVDDDDFDKTHKTHKTQGLIAHRRHERIEHGGLRRLILVPANDKRPGAGQVHILVPLAQQQESGRSDRRWAAKAKAKTKPNQSSLIRAVSALGFLSTIHHSSSLLRCVALRCRPLCCEDSSRDERRLGESSAGCGVRQRQTWRCQTFGRFIRMNTVRREDTCNATATHMDAHHRHCCFLYCQ
jgi:hypothetical protein